jgi:hypothetical protein
MSGVIDWITGHAVIILAVVAIAEGVLAAWLVRRNEEIRIRLGRASSAAEQAARAAALAAPGAIDPEIVIHLLRTGQSVTLDAVHELMERREQSSAVAR